jgi:hypothetical protein
MKIDNFIRFAEVIKLKTDKRVVSVTVRPTVADCTGNVYFTDLQLQEGGKLTGNVQNTDTMLVRPTDPPSYHNGIVRTGDTIIIFNLGETSVGLDCYVYPLQAMAAGSVQLSQGYGSHKCVFKAAASAGDEFALKASTRECLRNGSPTPKRGFFQYSAAYDSKHQVKLEDRKSARVYFEYTAMLETEVRQ